MNAYIESVIANVKEKHASEPEFVQAVEEVLSSLSPVVDAHPEYEKAALLEKMVEPERTIEFRVPWVDDNGQTHVNRGYRVQFIGSREGMPPDITEMMDAAEERTADKTNIHINIAVNYGGRDEIVHSVKAVAEKIKKGEIDINDITEDMISDGIYTAGQPDPDIIIRPSGEFRLSNFMTWQSAYSEFWFSDILWPDFKEEDLNKALEAFQKRNRRFGGV